MTDDDKRTAAATKRWHAAAHAMQSGVAYEMNIPGREHATRPKDLRVGVNTGLCDHAALARLLVAKGIISEVEYLEAIADEMEREVARYEARAPAGVKFA